MVPRPSLSRRDLILLSLGALITRLWLSPQLHSSLGSTLLENPHADTLSTVTKTTTATTTATATAKTTTTATRTVTPLPAPTQINPNDTLPATSLIDHAPGWTLFKDLYMSDGTFFIVSDKPADFPQIRMMTSTGLAADSSPGNEQAREPTSRNMEIITTEDAKGRWGENATHRVLGVDGNTFIVNEPYQHLKHYYHFVAELFFGFQVFWHGAFFRKSPSSSAMPAIHRLLFPHANADGWRDVPGFNAYFLQSAYPTIHVEVQEDWNDRISLSAKGSRVWHFPILMLSDRSAAHRGLICGSQTQRIASEAWKHMQPKLQLLGIRGPEWWEPIRTAMLLFAGAPTLSSDYNGAQAALFRDPLPDANAPKKVVISYISRQGTTRRRLTDDSHTGLVTALQNLVKSKGEAWELNIVQAETLTKEEQLKIAARTDVLVGVHGNGLTHLLVTPPTPISAVVEIFYPGGFAHDYEWTARALNKKHYSVWNDSFHTYPDEPEVNYPEGFQGASIPVHGPAVAQLIETHLEGKL
ncbi:hypothetical protein C8R43DRAFT_878630 [Mycena crocata]|nr:hypothetical protein C8R43DRAFT_878630 [Mycena crocata]